MIYAHLWPQSPRPSVEPITDLSSRAGTLGSRHFPRAVSRLTPACSSRRVVWETSIRPPRPRLARAFSCLAPAGGV